MELRLLVPFRRHAAVAQRATPERRRFTSSVLVPYLGTLLLTWTGVVPGWVLWPVMVLVFGTMTVLGNVWADQDALDALKDDPDTDADGHPGADRDGDR
ncbi:hypothetical protein E3T26_12575 [Cryobacterium sp. TMT1-21]|uniref:hypothetical protein n=1 Tax=unclassified Cryobacterium TaxID=2649013 RepID=UPI0010691178|nr:MULTISPECIES: hypothetical protein [unclassified Cryobacterium]TFC84102.1 hypothetical protein E3T24_10785 [Cryobacterium sp. TmT2-59]TFD11549.1 hypothetical protein E3T26_12575 [Cryobacterium sp. TMT1-21]TFD20229.1 hypothetical protein E3T42_02760 [Cryobacterium sp. TMT4-10]TFD23196.1 hypothetical protein E3T32_05580 [Cryobacterium sp. TMT2-23]